VNLKKRIDKEYSQGIKRFNALYAMYRARMMSVFADHSDAVLQSILTHLSVLPEKPDYIVIRKFGIEKRIGHDIGAILDLCADQMSLIYEESHRSFDLYGRLFSAYLARKASPPWVTVKVNLKDEIPSKRRGLGTAQFHYHMNNLAALIMKQINLALMNGESNHKIMQRVRALVKISRKKRESRGVETVGYRLAEANNDDQYYFDMSQEVFQTNPYEVTEGVFSLEDVQRLQAAQERAFGWSTRDLGDGLVQARQNVALQQLERSYMSDMVERLHAGMTTNAEDNLGIQDYVWVVSKPQPECDECTDRDGMTMKEIKDTFGTGIIEGSYPPARGDSPPSLHPHCKCQIVPKINDEWAKNTLKSEGYEWDQESGEAITFEPDADQKKLGFTALSWNDWLSTVAGVNQ